jgi:hypothetical protein
LVTDREWGHYKENPAPGTIVETTYFFRNLAKIVALFRVTPLSGPGVGRLSRRATQPQRRLLLRVVGPCF